MWPSDRAAAWKNRAPECRRAVAWSIEPRLPDCGLTRALLLRPAPAYRDIGEHPDERRDRQHQKKFGHGERPPQRGVASIKPNPGWVLPPALVPRLSSDCLSFDLGLCSAYPRRFAELSAL